MRLKRTSIRSIRRPVGVGSCRSIVNSFVLSREPLRFIIGHSNRRIVESSAHQLLTFIFVASSNGKRGGEEDGEGEEDDGRRQRGRPTVPLPQFAQLEGDAAAGETVGENASASPPPAPAPAWRCTMGIRGTAAMASLTPRRADLPSSMTRPCQRCVDVR